MAQASTNYGAQTSHNFGSITNNFNVTGLASSLPQLPSPSPSIIIPFRRDRDFVARPVLDDVWQRASEPGARVGLVGLGGVGKSQIAIEYAYRCREADPKVWVFWVHASSVARFEESYRKIAERLQLKGWNEPKADVLGMVHGWLSEESNGRWRMVVDNADSAKVMFEPWNGGTGTLILAESTGASPADYLPNCPHGSIVVTSRSREVVEGLVEVREDILDVRPMEEEVAVALLRKKLQKQEWGDGADNMTDLVRQLDCMPLAITQAAAYINQRAPRVRVSGYTEILKDQHGERATLLQKDIRDPRRDGRASNSIIMTWHVSFEYRIYGAAICCILLFDNTSLTTIGKGKKSFDPMCDSLRRSRHGRISTKQQRHAPSSHRSQRSSPTHSRREITTGKGHENSASFHAHSRTSHQWALSNIPAACHDIHNSTGACILSSTRSPSSD